MFALSGAYLGIPHPFDQLADWLEPPTDANAGVRIVDQVIYWLAYLHFGRINGIGIPCGGPGRLRHRHQVDLGGVRTDPRRDVRHRRDDVVEPGGGQTLRTQRQTKDTAGSRGVRL